MNKFANRLHSQHTRGTLGPTLTRGDTMLPRADMGLDASPARAARSRSKRLGRGGATWSPVVVVATVAATADGGDVVATVAAMADRGDVVVTEAATADGGDVVATVASTADAGDGRSLLGARGE
jgi:hypothetical protein